MRIQIANYKGLIPKLSNALLPDGCGSTVINCNLDSGEIRSIHAPSVDKVYPSTNSYKCIHRYDNKWLPFTNVVDMCPSFIPTDTNLRSFYTMPGQAPKVFIKTGVTTTGEVSSITTDTDLGLPAPGLAPTVTVTGSGSGTVYQRLYLCTYVSTLGEEGPPSAVSTAVSYQVGQTITLSDLPGHPSGDYDVSYKNVYRSISGSSATSFQFVAQLAVGTTSYVDTVPDLSLGNGLITAGWIKPPSDMTGLVPMPGGFFAGFTGKQVCFSVPNYPHAWPIGYRVNVDYNIVGLGVNGNVLVVLTESKPYLINIPNPSTFSITKISDVIPCMSKQGIVSTLSGVIFPGPDGFYVAGGGGIQNITPDLLTRREWDEYNPSSMKGAFYDNKYFCFHDGGTFFFSPFSQTDRTIKRLNVVAEAVRVTDTDNALYYLQQNSSDMTIYKYEGSQFPLNAQWKSKLYLTDLINFAAAQVFAEYPATLTEEQYQELIAGLAAAAIAAANGQYKGDFAGQALNTVAINGSILDPLYVQYSTPQLINFNVYADNVLMYSTQILSNEPFPIPAVPAARKWEIEINSKGVAIQEMFLATSFAELAIEQNAGLVM